MKMAVCVVLVVAVVLTLTACFFGGSIMAGSYSNADDYQIGNFEYRAADAQKLAVNWYSGNVSLVRTEGDVLKVSESGENLPPEKALHWLLKDGVLRVEFCASGYSGRFSGQDKKLTVEIPDGMEVEVLTTSGGIQAELGKQAGVTLRTTSGAVEINGKAETGSLRLGTTSGSIRVETVMAQDLIANTTSGAVKMQDVTVNDGAQLESTSGGINVESLYVRNGTVTAESSSGSVRMDALRAENLIVGTTSGGVTIGLKECKRAAVETTSGSVRINLSQSLGATIQTRSTSGGFNGSGYRYEDGKYVWGDGSCEVSLRTTSGSITVK